MALPIFAYYMQAIYKDKTLGYSEDDVFDVPKDFNPCPTEGAAIDGDEEESLEDIFE
jgi:penicillin-binding protein 1A